jgi:hypothetical protein
VPVSVAGNLFGWDANDHCFVKRQPSTPSESDQALHAVRGAELECIRYRGHDPDILARFAELGVPHLCDFGARFDLQPLLRNQVTFLLKDGPAETPEHLADLFRRYVLAARGNQNRATLIEYSEGSASFAFAWFEDHLHKVTFFPLASDLRWFIRHEGSLGVSDWLHEWLTESLDAMDIRWFADSDLDRSMRWRGTPW